MVADPISNNLDVLAVSGSGIAPTVGSPFTAGTQPSRVTVAPNGHFVYVANFDSISAFSIGLKGVFTALGPTATGSVQTPSDMIVDATGKFLIVGNPTAQNVSVFAISAANGSLPTTGVQKAVNVNPQSLAMSGNFLYIAGNNKIDGYVLNTTTGALTSMGGPFTNNLFLSLSTLMAAPSGHFLYATDSAANLVYTFAVDQTTGIPTQQGAGVNGGLDPESMRFNASGSFLYVADKTGGGITLLSVNTTTGVLSAPTAVATLAQPTAMAFDPVNNFLNVLSNGNRLAVFSINASGALAPVTGSPFTVGTGPSGVAVGLPL